MTNSKGHINFNFDENSLDQSNPSSSSTPASSHPLPELTQSPRPFYQENRTNSERLESSDIVILNVNDLPSQSQNIEASSEKIDRGNIKYKNRVSSLLNSNDPNEFLTEKYMEEHFDFENLSSDNIFKSTAHYLKKYYTPSASCGLSYLYKRVPFIKWIQDYNIREDFLIDLVTGLTVSISLVILEICLKLIFVSFFINLGWNRYKIEEKTTVDCFS
jgi:hypothetical protein